MKSSSLCVIGIGLLFQDFAQIRVYYEFAALAVETKGLWLADMKCFMKAQSSWFKNAAQDTKADTELSERKWEAPVSHTVYATSILRTTPQADKLNENEMDPVDVQRAANRTKLYLECAEKTGVTAEMILFVKRGTWNSQKPELKYWVQCVLVKHHLMTEQGVLRLDVAFQNLTALEKNKIEANIDKCLPTKPMKPLDISWKFAQCFQKRDPKNSLF